MRIRASSIRRIPGCLSLDGEVRKKVLAALEIIFPEAFAFVNITSRIVIQPHAFTDGLGITIIDPDMGPEPIHVWRPGEKEPVEVEQDKLVYRILTMPNHTLGVFACWE
jgi:hypothetical protein